MPAQVTHFLQSNDVCDKLNISGDYRQAVALGALGPDFLYYHKLFSDDERFRKAGVQLHELSANRIFSAFAEYIINHPENEFAIYYAYGFLCHYALDSTAHPFVYFVQNTIIKAENNRKKPFFTHVRIEHFLDVIMLRDKRDCSVGQFGLKNCVPNNTDVLSAVGDVCAFVLPRLFDDFEITAKQCEKAFLSTRRYLGLANDRSGIKRFFVRIFETLCFMPHTVSYFLHPFMEDGEWDYSNYEKAEWIDENSDTPHGESFFELYDKSVNLSTDLCKEFMEFVSSRNCDIQFTHNYDMKGRKK